MAPELETPAQVDIGEYKWGFHDEEKPVFKTRRGLDEDVVREISAHKGEPAWMLEFRLKAYEIFRSQADAHAGAPTSAASTSRTSSTT